MKKIMNKPGDIVAEMLKGLELSDPRIVSFPEERVAARREKTKKVGVVSGGGSGHEPAHAGYVGKGMLDAAVAGNIFASPSPVQMMKGIEEASAGQGVLMVLTNYTGDLMNFSMAQELAEMEDIEVDHVVVRDDVAVPESTYSAGRRGIAGAVFIHKIAGAMAERGSSLAEVKRVAEKAIGFVRTMGMSMTACT
ncbi:MAG: dihydroxyacetone kinase subunit DhaK, partial [Acetanaerobacterium sp.]